MGQGSARCYARRPSGRSCRSGRWQGPEVYFAGRAWPWATTRGDVAQLGERCVRIAEVRGSSPLISTIRRRLEPGGRRRRRNLTRIACQTQPSLRRRHRLALRAGGAPRRPGHRSMACAGDSDVAPGQSAPGASDASPSPAADGARCRQPHLRDRERPHAVHAHRRGRVAHRGAAGRGAATAQSRRPGHRAGQAAGRLRRAGTGGPRTLRRASWRDP